MYIYIAKNMEDDNMQEWWCKTNHFVVKCVGCSGEKKKYMDTGMKIVPSASLE